MSSKLAPGLSPCSTSDFRSNAMYPPAAEAEAQPRAIGQMPGQVPVYLPEDEEDHQRDDEEVERRHREVQEGVVVALKLVAGLAHEIALPVDYRKREVDQGRGMKEEYHLVGIGGPGEADKVRPGHTG